MAKTCTHCKDKKEEMEKIPFISAECEATRQHKTIKLIVIGWIITILLLFGSNLAWTIYNSQFETVTETITETYDVDLMHDTENGNNNCIVNGGEICNGTAESEN